MSRPTVVTRPTIVEAIWGLDRGGAEVLLLERLRASDRDAADYVVVTSRPELRGLTPDFEELGIRVVVAGSRRVAATVKRLRPAIVNVHSPRPALWLKSALAAGYFGRTRPRLIETIHSERYGHPAFEFTSSRLNPVLDRVVAVSRAVADSQLARLAPRLDIVRPGVDVATISQWSRPQTEALRDRFDVLDTRVLLAMVAGFRTAKNHLRLVEAIETLARSGFTPADLGVILAGDGPTRGSVETAIRARGLGDFFRFVGNVPRAWRVIATADAALLTSDREGLPVVVMEAIAAGRPVLSTDVGGVSELVADGQTGLLFDPADTAAAIGRFVGDADLRVRLTRQAAARRADVDIRHTAAAMERIYGVARLRRRDPIRVVDGLA